MNKSPYKLDKKLFQAYQACHYKLLKQGITIIIGQENKSLNEFLVDNKVFSYAIVSAFNPGSVLKPNDENMVKHNELKNYLLNKNLQHQDVENVDPMELWPKELAFLILDINKGEAKKLAMSFGQYAIVYGNLNTVSQLIVL